MKRAVWYLVAVLPPRVRHGLPPETSHLGQLSIYGGTLIHIALGPIEALDPATCPLGRSYKGWREGMNDPETYLAGRGRWVLGAPADRERYALISGAGIVRLAIEIRRIGASNGTDERDLDGRRTIEGDILTEGHPVFDTYVGKASPLAKNRNPVGYYDTPLDGRTCGCGCGEAVPIRKDFVVGHDQRAIHERIARVGSVRDFLTWFDKTWTQTPN